MKDFLRKHGYLLTNLFLVVCLGNYIFEQARKAWMADRLDFVEIAFAGHNVVMLAVILIRKQHQALDRNVFHQGIALVAFFSGIFFIDATTQHPLLLRISQAITVVSIGLGIMAFIHLGRSFGILIAIREVKTGGLYRIIRHPMYATDILWRVGIILKNPCAVNFMIFMVSSGCYVYRAMLEEKFLGQWSEYRQYMEKVKYRFIPFLF